MILTMGKFTPKGKLYTTVLYYGSKERMNCCTWKYFMHRVKGMFQRIIFLWLLYPANSSLTCFLNHLKTFFNYSGPYLSWTSLFSIGIVRNIDVFQTLRLRGQSSDQPYYTFQHWIGRFLSWQWMTRNHGCSIWATKRINFKR